MPQREDKGNVVKRRERKPDEINCANNPEPLFEFEPAGAHDRTFVSDRWLYCNARLRVQSGETTNRLRLEYSLTLTHNTFADPMIRPLLHGSAGRF
jgi:hypothetical protein